MHTARMLLLALIASAAIAAPANAATPILHDIGHDRMHPTATFAAAGADSVTIYFSSSPERATDGRFLSEDSVSLDLMIDSEIATGNWMDADRLDPGTYYVMLHAEQYSCYVDEGDVCMEGYSNVVTLTIPKPRQRFRATVDPGVIASFQLTVTPLGESLPYRLCWARSGRSRMCEKGTVLGTDWSEAQSDSVVLTLDDLKLGPRQKRVRFAWIVAGKRVASKTVRIGR